MGSSPSSPEEAEQKRQIHTDRIRQLTQFTILLVGSAESGKTTILKQLYRKFLPHHANPANDHRHVVVTLHENIRQCVLAIFEAGLRLGINMEEEEEMVGMVQRLRELGDKPRIDRELAAQIKLAWQSEKFQQIYARRSEFWLLDGCPYYLTHIERFCQDDFVPTQEDILRAYDPTLLTQYHDLDIPVTTADLPGFRVDLPPHINLHLRIIDVPGQRALRGDWPLRPIDAIISALPLTSYSQVLPDNPSIRRIDDDLALFDSIISQPNFQDSYINLWFTKMDLFHEAGVDEFNKYYPPPGGAARISTLELVREQFLARTSPGRVSSFDYMSGLISIDVKSAFQSLPWILLKKRMPLICRETAKLDKLQKYLSKHAS